MLGWLCGKDVVQQGTPDVLGPWHLQSVISWFQHHIFKPQPHVRVALVHPQCAWKGTERVPGREQNQ